MKYTDDNLLHHFIIKNHINIDSLNLYIILFILVFKILKMILLKL